MDAIARLYVCAWLCFCVCVCVSVSPLHTCLSTCATVFVCQYRLSSVCLCMCLCLMLAYMYLYMCNSIGMDPHLCFCLMFAYMYLYMCNSIWMCLHPYLHLQHLVNSCLQCGARCYLAGVRCAHRGIWYRSSCTALLGPATYVREQSTRLYGCAHWCCCVCVSVCDCVWVWWLQTFCYLLHPYVYVYACFCLCTSVCGCNTCWNTWMC